MPRATLRNRLGLYFHIPFCRARCGYCDFVAFTGKEDRIDAYVEDLCRELSLYSLESSLSSSIRTVFFGGGTPSLLEARHVHRLLEHVRQSFVLDPGAEITLEANPESVNEDKAVGWRQAGVNRISLGLQAFDDRILKAADRLHSAEDFVSAFDRLRRAAFDNVSADLIYGLPGQSLEDWKMTLRRTVAMDGEHLSLYALHVEPHTPFQAAGVTTHDDVQADMYEWARLELAQAGYTQYEISNFSKPGRACQHNLIYWRQENYLGIGCGAVGCVDGFRWENHKNLADYQRAITKNEFPRVSEEVLDPADRQFERLMLGLRLREGIAWDDASSPQWRQERDRLQAAGRLEEVEAGVWRIPDAYIALSNQVLLPFLP